jgi:hypothetical protein
VRCWAGAFDLDCGDVSFRQEFFDFRHPGTKLALFHINQVLRLFAPVV